MHNLPSLPVSNEVVAKKKERAEALARHRILFGHSGALLTHESFRFFLTEIVEPKWAEATKGALDRSKTMEERDAALVMRDALQEVLFWARDTLEDSRTYINNAEQEDKAHQ